MSLRLPPAARHRDFRRYMSARLLTNVGVEMMVVAVGYQVYSLTRNPLDLGLVGLSQFLPFMVLVLPAGHVADRFDRRRIVTVCYAVDALCAIGLLWFTISGIASPLPVFAVMSLFGMAVAFGMPTSQALLPNLVPRAHFGNAVAINSSTMQLATIAGPAIGGFVFLAGAGVVYASVAVLATVAAALLLGVRAGGRGERAREPMSLTDALSGVLFVRSRPVVLGSISLDLFAVLFGGAVALLPVYATDILHAGPTGLGILRSAPAVGAALCGVGLGVRPVTRHVGRWMFGGVVLFGLSTLIFGVSTSFWLSLVALAVAGAADMVSMYVRHLLVQLETPDEIRGRVSAVNAVFIGASNELGEFESGVTAAWFGTVPAVLIGGLASIVVAVAWSRWFPGLRTLDRFPGHVSGEASEPIRAAAAALPSEPVSPPAASGFTDGQPARRGGLPDPPG